MSLIKNKQDLQKGQTLIEVLAALSVAAVLMFGITVAVIFSLDSVQFIKNQNLANTYAQEGMEVTKQIWNSDIAYFDSLPSQGNFYCLDKGSSTLTAKSDNTPFNGQGCNGDNLNPFSREVDLYKNSTDCALNGAPTPTPQAIKVVVTVSWSDGKCIDRNNLYCHKVQLNSCLSKSYPLNEP